jgi:hypothetical protein
MSILTIDIAFIRIGLTTALNHSVQGPTSCLAMVALSDSIGSFGVFFTVRIDQDAEEFCW